MRYFGPKKADHISCGEPCFLCQDPFKEGDMTALIPIKPADEEEAAKMKQGRPYNALAKEVHANCYDALKGILQD